MTRTMTHRRLLLLVASGLALLAGVATAWRAIDAWRVDDIVRHLTSADPAAREAAVVHLALLRDERDLRRLVSYLGDEDERVRACVVEALARIGAPAIEPAAALAKSALKEPFYYTPLYWRLCERFPWLHGPWKQLTLFEGGNVALANSVPVKLGDTYEGLFALFPRLGAPAIGPLISLAGEKAQYPRSLALRCLARMGDPRSIEVLEGSAGAPEFWTAIAAIDGIAFLEKARASALADASLNAAQRELWRVYDAKRPGVIDALVAQLRHRAPGARLAAVKALRTFAGDGRVFDRLVSAVLSSESGDIRSEALRVLGSSGNPRVPGIVADRFADWGTSSAAFEVTMRLNADEQLTVLTQALGCGPKEALSAGIPCFYAIHDETMVPKLVARYRTATPAERLTIARALEGIAKGLPKDSNIDLVAESRGGRIQAAARKAVEDIRAAEKRVK